MGIGFVASARAIGGIDSANAGAKEETMRDTDHDPASRPDATDELPRQPPRLSPEQIERLEDYEELEEFIEEPPQGDLAIISDQDVPGAPG
jgi:hypothetical protein